MSVKNRSYLDAAEEREEHIHPKDPAYGTFAIIFELVFSDVGLDWLGVRFLIIIQDGL